MNSARTSRGYKNWTDANGVVHIHIPSHIIDCGPKKRRKQRPLPFKLVVSGNPLEHNDCTVEALSEATPLTYQEAHDICQQAGRKDRHGFLFIPWMSGIVHSRVSLSGIKFSKAFDWCDFSNQNQICGNKKKSDLTLGQFIDMKLPGNYIVVVAQHAFAVVDGVIHDGSCRGRRKMIQKIYKAEL